LKLTAGYNWSVGLRESEADADFYGTPYGFLRTYGLRCSFLLSLVVMIILDVIYWSGSADAIAVNEHY
jgi:hypothetical protein